MGAPVAAVRGLFGLFRGVAAREAGKVVTQEVAQASAATVAKRSFGSYFTEIAPDAMKSVKTTAFKDGIFNTIKANAADQFKHNMGGRWGIILPMALSTAFGLKDAWTEAANDPNWLTKPFSFAKGLAWAAIPAAVGGAVSLGYLSLFPQARGIPSMLLQNMTYSAGEFMAKNVVGKPKAALAPENAGQNNPEMQAQLAAQQQAQALQQQQLAAAQQLQVQQQQYAQQLAQQMQNITQPQQASSTSTQPLGLDLSSASNPFNLNQTAPAATSTPLPQVNAALAQKVGLQPNQLADLDQKMTRETGKSLSQMFAEQGITA